MPTGTNLDMLRARLRRLARRAAAFGEAFSKHSWHDPAWVFNSAEVPMMARAVALADALRDFDGADVSTFAGLESPRETWWAVESLRAVFAALMERWGWTPALGPGGRAYRRECRKRHERDRERPFFEAALSLCPVDPTWNGTADLADRLGRGYEASMSPEEAASKIDRLSLERVREPIFGTSLPQGDSEDLAPIARATRVIASAGRLADEPTPPLRPPEASSHADAPPPGTEPPAPGGEPAVPEPTHREGQRPNATGNGTTLNRKDIDILRALLSLKAFDSESRKKQVDIAAEAWGRGADPDQCKRPCAKLKKLDLIDTKEGPGGGSWLTPQGRKRVESR